MRHSRFGKQAKILASLYIRITYEEMLKNPEDVLQDLELKSDMIYMIVGVLAKNMNKDNIQKYYEFLRDTQDIQDEFLVMAMTMATARDESLKKTKTYIDYEIDYQDIGA